MRCSSSPLDEVKHKLLLEADSISTAGLPGRQHPIASKLEFSEFSTALLVMFGGWEGKLFPNLLVYPFLIHLRGQNEEEEFSFLIWG